MSLSLLHKLTSSSSLALVCSILSKVVSPAFTMAVDRVWPETQCAIIICSNFFCFFLKFVTGCTSTHTNKSPYKATGAGYWQSSIHTYLLQLFRNIWRVLPKLGSEAFSQEQRVEESNEARLGSLTQILWQAWLTLKHNQSSNMFGEHFLKMYYLFCPTYICWYAFHSWRFLLCPVWVQTLELRWTPTEPESSYKEIITLYV